MLINSGEDITNQDDHEINSDSNSTLYRKGIEPLTKIEWQFDLRAQKDLSRCTSSLVLIDPPQEKSIEQILNHIVNELMRQGIVDSKQELLESLLTGTDHKLNRWIEIDNFLVLSTPIHGIKGYHYVVCNLGEPTDIGLSDSISYVTLILGKEQIKESKSVHQVASTFANAYLDPQLRHDLLRATSLEESKDSFNKFQSRELSREFRSESSSNIHDVIPNHAKPFLFGCLIRDYKKRIPVYWSDWSDGFRSKYAIGKTMSATFFLYTACLLPAIAFGVLNSINTNGEMTIAKHFLAQGLGGIIFSMVSGQPLVILLATAPLSIFIKLTHSIALENNLDFWHFYALIGIFNACFLIIYAITGASTMMKYSSPFVEETFALFITIAFLFDGGREIESQLELAIVLMTLWICYKLSNFKETVFFNLKIRELLSDYALPLGVLISAALTYALRVNTSNDHVGTSHNLFHIMKIQNFPIWAYFAALGIGFLLSLLFFVDQNISCMLASAPKHKLKKWTGFHADLMATALINIMLSVLGLPWIHGAIPHSALHVRALALLQKTLKNGVLEEKFLRVQETRGAAFLSHALLLVSLLMLPIPLKYIPNAVLYGVFWYLGVKALVGNQFWNRVLLLVTDQHCFPPSIVDRQVVQREVHKFTAVQIVCLGIFCFVSFYPNPYMTAIFPFLVVLLIPIRKFLLPYIFTRRALQLLDGY